jgi:hypothetical protein
MPFTSQAQRGLMYSAASRKGGAGGVSQSVAKKLVAEDKPGKLPEHAKTGRKMDYSKSKK